MSGVEMLHALVESLMEIYSNPPILYTMALNQLDFFPFSFCVQWTENMARVGLLLVVAYTYFEGKAAIEPSRKTVPP